MLTIITQLSLLTALSYALPHAHQLHHKLHAVRAADLEAHAVKLAPIHLAGRDVPITHNLSPIGQCGGSSGFGCGPGLCCSTWGYCGKGPSYCGDGGAKSKAHHGHHVAPPGYSPPATSASPSPPAYSPPAYSSPAGSAAPPTTSAAPTMTSAPVAPSSYSPPAPSSSAAGGSGWWSRQRVQNVLW